MKEFSKLRTEAYGDMLNRKQKLLNRSNDAYSKGDLPTMRKAHSLAMKQDSRTRAKYPDEDRKRVMSGANSDYTSGKRYTGDSVEYPEDTNVIGEGMPASVIKNKTRNANMSDSEFAEAHKDKSDDDLKSMAHRHGYGEGSAHYINRRNKGKSSENGLGEGQRGLWDNIHAKRERIKNGSGEHMRKPGSKGAPTAKALRVSAEAVNPAQQAAIAIAMKKAGKKPKNEEVEIDEGIMDFMSNTPVKPKSKLSLSAMRDISRRMDTKNKMPKVSRASNDSENTNAGFRLVRAEEKDEREYGYEGDMALNQLKTLVRCAEMIEELLKPDTDMPEWVQSKITLATDYIQTAADYMYSEMNEAKKMKGEDPCWTGYHMIGTKPKGGKQVPNCVPEEVEHTDESRQVYYINSIKNKDPAVAQAKRLKNKMAKPRMLNSPRTTLKMGEAFSARDRLVMALDKEKKKREEQDAARAAREAAAQAKTPPPEKEIKEGIARLISKNIKRVTATKPTPQQKADIRLNK